MNTEEDMVFECNDPECWCRMADEIRKNDDMDRADEAWAEFRRGLEQGLCVSTGTESR